MRRIPLKSGDEVDALGPARHHHTWRAGQRDRIKRSYRRRERRHARAATRRETTTTARTS